MGATGNTGPQGPKGDPGPLGPTWTVTDSASIVTGGQTRLQVTAAGQVLTPSIHNNPSTSDTRTAQLASGTYTPTLTPLMNVAVADPDTAQWLRVGNVVTVSGTIRLSCTSGAGTQCGVRISLPVPSTFTKPGQLAGTAFSSIPTNLMSHVVADTNNGAASMFFVANGTMTPLIHVFQFTYQVL